MANILPLKGALVGAATQGAQKTNFTNLRDSVSMLLGAAQFEAVSPAAFSFSSGVMSINNDYDVGGYINVAAGPGTGAFNLDGIVATNFRPGQILMVGTNAARPMTVRHQRSSVTNGQILLRGGTDVTLNDRESTLMLRLESAQGPWREISRSGGAGGAGGGGFGTFNFRAVVSNANYQKPDNLSAAIVIAVGAGGGGAGKPRTNSSGITLASGGGGAGGIVVKFFNEADLPASCPMQIGVGGAGGSDATTYTAGSPRAAYARGSSGGHTTFSGTGITTLQGNGGDGGYAAVRGRSGIGLLPNFQSSAAGGTAAGGDWNLVGESGDPGLAIDIDDSVRKHNELGGRGGSSPFGSSPAMLYNANAIAHPAGSYGAGGNAPIGGTDTWQNSYNGAAGAPGAVFIVEILN